MEGHNRVYGAGELTPDVIRSARFSTRDGAYHAGEVQEFLEQVASAMEVYQSTDVAQAMRRELQRNADIAARVLLAGQETAERLRAQGADDARAIVEDTKRLAEQLRDATREELRRNRGHVEELRRTFVEELRDLYDRIGATLYRFDNASKMDELDEAPPAPSPGLGTPSPGLGVPSPGFGHDPAGSGYEEHPQVHIATEPLSPRAEAGPRPPAWTQLPDAPPADAYEADAPQQFIDDAIAADPAGPAVTPGEPSAGAVWGEEPSSVWSGESEEAAPHAGQSSGWLIDDAEEAAGAEPAADLEPAVWGEPPQPGGGDEPLVDLRDIQDQIHGEGAAVAASAGVMEEEPQLPVAEAPAAEVEAPAESGAAPAEEPSADDDARAEALIAGLGEVLGQAEEPPPPLPEPPSLTGGANGESTPDPAALAAFVLQSLAEGQSRDGLEGYLRDSYGVLDPAAYVDAVLAAAQAEQPPQ